VLTPEYWNRVGSCVSGIGVAASREAYALASEDSVILTLGTAQHELRGGKRNHSHKRRGLARIDVGI